MKTLGNIIWIIFGGLHIALEYFIAGLVLMITIIGIPFSSVNSFIRHEDSTAMEYVGQRHCCSISQSLSSLMTFGAAFPANTNIFLPLR